MEFLFTNEYKKSGRLWRILMAPSLLFFVPVDLLFLLIHRIAAWIEKRMKPNQLKLLQRGVMFGLTPIVTILVVALLVTISPLFVAFWPLTWPLWLAFFLVIVAAVVVGVIRAKRGLPHQPPQE